MGIWDALGEAYWIKAACLDGKRYKTSTNLLDERVLAVEYRSKDNY